MTASVYSAQLTLDGYTPPPRFDGWTYREAYDRARLVSELHRVLYWMLDCQPHSLRELARLCGGLETGIAARIRDLRKARFGGFTVVSGRVKGLESSGLYMYRLVNPTREKVEMVLRMGQREAT